jgi:hypothetical protein
MEQSNLFGRFISYEENGMLWSLLGRQGIKLDKGPFKAVDQVCQEKFNYGIN